MGKNSVQKQGEHMENRVDFDAPEFDGAFATDAPLGAFCEGERTRFALWSPLAQRVTLRLFTHGSGGRAFLRVPLERGKRGVWTCTVPRRLHGAYYDYQVTTGGTAHRAGDPYARACGVNGGRGMVVDLSGTNPPGWEKDAPPARQAEDVIYELHVSDFSWDASSGVTLEARGRYAAFCQANTTLNADGVHPTCVAYLRELGVTHVELMPVYDFGSVDEADGAQGYNWGYDPMNHSVPEGSYASDAENGAVRIRELKQAVQALHRAGLRVVMDVVYNHTFNFHAPLFTSAPWAFYRRQADGRPANGSGCGNEVASERAMCARYILDSVLYWAEEYHIDGFRFDLMGLLDVPLMNRIRRALDERYGEGEKLVFGEPWGGGPSGARPGTHLADKGRLRELAPGVGAFCDMTRDMVRGDLSQPESRGFASGGRFDARALACCVRGWAGEGMPYAAPSQTISYLSCHDDWTLWDKLVCALDGRRDFAGTDARVLRAGRLAAAILMCCQGRIFLQAGEEFGRTKLGERNTYASGAWINRLDWRRAWENRALVDYYRGLIALRKQLPALCDKTPNAWRRILEASDVAPGVARILLDNAGDDTPCARVLLLVNAGEREARAALPPGEWAVLADGESSFLWKNPARIAGEACLAPVSALILGA